MCAARLFHFCHFFCLHLVLSSGNLMSFSNLNGSPLPKFTMVMSLLSLCVNDNIGGSLAPFTFYERRKTERESFRQRILDATSLSAPAQRAHSSVYISRANFWLCRWKRRRQTAATAHCKHKLGGFYHKPYAQSSNFITRFDIDPGDRRSSSVLQSVFVRMCKWLFT